MTDTAFEQPGPEQGDGVGRVGQALRPGAQLARCRQERGMSVEEVAKQLNLAPRQIQAIENENFAALPGMASVRGFIRGYAKLLKIDAAPLLEMVAKETVVLEEPVTLTASGRKSFAGNRLPRMGRPAFSLKPLLGIAVPVLLLAGAFVLHRMDMLPPLPAALDGKIRELSSASTPAFEEANPKALSAMPAGDVLPALSVKTETIAAPIAALAEQNAPHATEIAAQAPAVHPAPAPDPVTAPASSANLLVLKLSQDSWVEALRANRTPLVSRVVKAGTTETIEVVEPVSLTIGNAAGAEVTWRGNRLDLQSGAKNNVYRIHLK